MHLVSLSSNSQIRKIYSYCSYITKYQEKIKIMKHTSSFAFYPLITSSFLATLSSPKRPVWVHYVLWLTKVLTIFFLEFPIRFFTIEDFPSNGSMEILRYGTWKHLCVADWDDAERTLVCQEQGYSGSSLEVHSKSGTNSSGNTTHSCEHLTKNCEEKINTEIKCSGIMKTFSFPQNESWVIRMWTDTSIAISCAAPLLKMAAFG